MPQPWSITWMRPLLQRSSPKDPSKVMPVTPIAAAVAGNERVVAADKCRTTPKRTLTWRDAHPCIWLLPCSTLHPSLLIHHTNPQPPPKPPWRSSRPPRQGSRGGGRHKRRNDWPEEEKEQGRADSVEVSDQLIVAVVANLLVKTCTQSCVLVLDIISWYLICAHSWGQPPFAHF